MLLGVALAVLVAEGAGWGGWMVWLLVSGRPVARRGRART